MRYINLFSFLTLLLFTSYVISGDTSTIQSWYSTFLVATFILLSVDFMYKMGGAVHAMWISLMWFMIWISWELAVTFILLSLPHMKLMLYDFDITLAIFLGVSILNLGNVFWLFPRAVEEHARL